LRSSNFFLTRLLALISTALLPLVLLHAYTLYRDYRKAEDDAYRNVLSRSRERAALVAELMTNAESILTFMTNREELLKGDRDECAKVLNQMTRLNDLVANIVVTDAEGRYVCATIPPHAEPAPVFGDLDWFRTARTSSNAVVSEPYIGRTTQSPIFVVAERLLDADGHFAGVAALGFDIPKLGQRLGVGVPTQYASVGLVNAQNTLVTRFPDPQTWWGKQVPHELRQKRAKAPEGVIIGVGVDGQNRVLASTDVGRLKLRVTYGVLYDAALGPIKRDVRNSALLALFLLVLTIGLAYAGARGFRRPLTVLVDAIREQRNAKGEAPLVDENLPGEYQAVAVEFNRLTAARNASDGILKLAYRKSERMAAFYSSMSAVNKAITRSRTPLELYEALCTICTTTQKAVLAWVGEVDDRRIQPLVRSGPVDVHPQDLEIPLVVEDGQLLSAPAEAAITARPHLTEDYNTDERCAPWHARLHALGIRSGGSFPLRCQGQVVAVLSVYFSEANIWERELTTLLEELVEDVSYALDNFLREANRRKAQSLLREQQQQLSRLIESATDAILTVDGHLTVKALNKAACEVFRIAQDAALGSPLARLLTGMPAPEDCPDAGAAVLMQGSRPDGSTFPAETSWTLSGSGAGRLGLVVLRDLSKSHEEEAARQARVKAEAANQAKTQFISRMSHELRTPLNAVLGFSQLLQSSTQDRLSEAERRQLDHIFLAGAQLRALIDDVLDVSRLEAGTLAMDLRNVDIALLIEEVIRMSEPQALKYEVTLEQGYESAPIHLRTDPLRVKQVLLNLASNAIKYNRVGGKVTFGVRVRPGKLDIVVADTGLGMTSNQLAQIFQPFNRLGRERMNIEGTGMGMVIARQLVELLGGSLELDSTPGEGTCVTLTLPYVDSEDAVPVPLPLPDAPESSLGVLSTVLEAPPAATILYIEDNPVNALLVEQLLARWPQLRFEIAVDGSEGLGKAQALLPQLVLLDMHLPDMTGIEVLQHLKSNHVTRGLPVVALSASAMEEDINAARQAGADEYWTKPIEFDPFLSGIQRLLRAS
jgi:signal transduction histidine kinase/ActR/RegA family two-component response regulator